MLRTTLAPIALTAVFASSGASAATMYFNNGSGTYTADGVTASVSVTTSQSGDGLFYNSVENAIGIGSNVVNAGIGFKKLTFLVVPNFTEAETMTVSFDQEVTLDTIFFRQWENNFLGFGDEVDFDYAGGASGSGTLTFTDSGVSGLLDPFAVGVSLTEFTLRPEQNGAETSFYLHSVDFTVSEVPLPAAAYLFGSALAGLVAVGRRRAKAAAA